MLPLLREGLQDHPPELGRDVGTKLGRGSGRVVRDGQHQTGVAVRDERELPRQSFIQHHTERIDIGALVRVLCGGELLRRHICGRPQDGGAVGERRIERARREHCRNTEVEHLGLARRTVWARAQEDVVRLEVAVDHARTMRRAHSTERGQQQVDRLTALEAPAVEPRTERFAMQELHHQVGT
jgi:hypothetical protein